MIYTEAAKGIHASIVGSNAEAACLPHASEVVDFSAMDKEQTYAFLDGERPELYAIAAVFSNFTFQQLPVTRQRFGMYGLGEHLDPEIGLTSPVDSSTSVLELQQALSYTLKQAQQDCFARLGTQKEFQYWYTRMDEILGYFRDCNIRLGGNYESPEAFLDGGMGTAISVSLQTIDLVQQAHAVHAPEANDHEIAESARRAQRIALRLATVTQLEHINVVLACLSGIPWLYLSMGKTRPVFVLDKFITKPDSNNPNILDIGAPNLTGLSDPRHRMQVKELKTKLAHLKCPGLVEFEQADGAYTHTVGQMYQLCLELVTSLGLWKTRPTKLGSVYTAI